MLINLTHHTKYPDQNHSQPSLHLPKVSSSIYLSQQPVVRVTQSMI